MTTTVSFKVGSTFRVPVVYSPTANLAPTTLANVTITSQVRTKEGKKIADLVVTKDPGNLAFLITGSSTGSWPSGITALWDIKMVDGDGTYGTFYSETINLSLERRATE